jgi:histone-lysine N-methyltransferase SETMAR
MKNKVKEKSIAYNFSFVHPPLPISCEAVQTGKVYSFLTPHPVHIMTEVRDFIAALARTGKGMKEIKILADRAYGIKSLKRTQIYQIIKEVKEGKNTADQRHSNSKKTKRTCDVVAAVAAAIEEDRRQTLRGLALTLDQSKDTIRRILTEDLGFVKKSARWVPKLLTEDQKKDRVEKCNGLLQLVWTEGLGVLDRIVTMDKSAVSFHMPETKRQSKQWVKKGQPGPVKAKVHASRTKQMVLVFFDSKGVIYTNYVPRGSTVNTAYIKTALQRFVKVLKKKRPDMAAGDWYFHWDNAPVHTAATVQDYLAAKSIKTIPHPPYSPDLAPADYFLFPRVKAELAGISMTQDTFQKKWDGVLRTIAKDDFAAAFRR